jgi:hypothetical protein
VLLSLMRITPMVLIRIVLYSIGLHGRFHTLYGRYYPL